MRADDTSTSIVCTSNVCKPIILVAGLMALGVVADAAKQDASARDVPMGRHTKDEVKAACKQVDGINVDTGNGWYGCVNRKKGTQVFCNPDGKCAGNVPHDVPADAIRVGVSSVLSASADRNAGVGLRGGFLDDNASLSSQGSATTGAPAQPGATPLQVR